MPEDHRPDPHDDEDVEFPDQQSLIDAFMNGLCQKNQHDSRRLSILLASLPDPSLSHGQVNEVMAMPVTEVRKRGLTRSLRRNTLIVQWYITPLFMGYHTIMSRL